MKWVLMYFYLSGWSGIEANQKQLGVFDTKEQCQAILNGYKEQARLMNLLCIEIKD